MIISVYGGAERIISASSNIFIISKLSKYFFKIYILDYIIQNIIKGAEKNAEKMKKMKRLYRGPGKNYGGAGTNCCSGKIKMDRSTCII